MLLLPPQGQRYPPVLGQGSETGQLTAETSSFYLSSADCHSALGRLTSRGSSPGAGAAGGRGQGGKTAAPGKPLPTGSGHPLVVSAPPGPGVPPRGARLLGPAPRDPPALAPSRELGFISPAPGQPRLGSTVPRGVPLLSPPALLRESDNEDKTLEAGFSSGWINLPFSF